MVEHGRSCEACICSRTVCTIRTTLRMRLGFFLSCFWDCVLFVMLLSSSDMPRWNQNHDGRMPT